MSRKKLTIEECKQLAISRGGECLENVYINNRTKMKWRCEKLHEWEARFGNLKNKKYWCPHCSGCKKLTIEECHKVAKSRGGECLENVYIDGGVKMKWRCEKLHEWEAKFRDIKCNNTWCPYCAGVGKLTIEECHKVAKSRGGECLENVYIDNGVKMKWRCDKLHEWEARFGHIKNRKQWCPHCMNGKSEKLCRKIIEEITGKKFSSVRPDFLQNIKTGCNLELDGYNEELKLAFEYNGIQHYEYIPSRFHKKGKHLFIDQQERDKIKIQMCNKLGIKVIVIPYQYDYRDEDKLRLFIKSLI
jgi:hypothetical protein